MDLRLNGIDKFVLVALPDNLIVIKHSCLNNPVVKVEVFAAPEIVESVIDYLFFKFERHFKECAALQLKH